MSGHNKWSKVKHKKAATDAVKSKVFTKLIRLISVEAKKAGGNTESPGLKAAIGKAREANMPNDNIERAIKKAANDTGPKMEKVIYEAYGPGGVAVIIEGLTDNNNRTAAEIRHLLAKNNLELAQAGSALWAFTKTADLWQPKVTIDLSPEEKDQLLKLTEDLEDNDDVQSVFTNAAE